MDFESPDVMKDFPGLYASEMNKRCSNDSDYSDDADKVSKKDILIGKRKDKKDKKDKERGYAALEGESSAEENYDSRSPSKAKKSKSFKFTSKSKEKREKSREKEKEQPEKRKEKDKKLDKKGEKEKNKSEKKEKKSKSGEDSTDIADALPIFGVSLEVAVERSRCHDGIDIPLPVRACIDHVQNNGLMFEGVYKISGTKSKVVHLRKMYNHRENVNFAEYDIPTATSLLKMFLRDMPECVFTNDLLIRFEEAGAILNQATREKHLKILLDHLPSYNRLLLSWLIIHFYNVAANERINKMTKQHLAAALCPSLHTSTRLFIVLLQHCKSLFPDTVLTMYLPPLTSSAQLPDDLHGMETELKKQESLLTQIHAEMNAGFISKEREELLWEVQRIITQLKRKLKIAHKEATLEKNVEEKAKSVEEIAAVEENNEVANVRRESVEEEGRKEEIFRKERIAERPETIENQYDQVAEEPSLAVTSKTITEEAKDTDAQPMNYERKNSLIDTEILLLQIKNKELLMLKEMLVGKIDEAKSEIVRLRNQLQTQEFMVPVSFKNSVTGLDEVMDLLHKENQILEIEKINLVRQIMEQREICVELKARLGILGIGY